MKREDVNFIIGTLIECLNISSVYANIAHEDDDYEYAQELILDIDKSLKIMRGKKNDT